MPRPVYDPVHEDPDQTQALITRHLIAARSRRLRDPHLALASDWLTLSKIMAIWGLGCGSADG